jgi:hypothetical protein
VSNSITSHTAAVNGAHPTQQNGHIEHSIGTTPAELANRYELKRQTVKGAIEYHGANPFEAGATQDGFILNSDGKAFDRKINRVYTSREVAQLAGLSPDEYEPCRQWCERNGHSEAYQNGNANSHSAAKISKALKPIKAPFDWQKATIHEYRDEAGKLLFEVGRVGSGDTKSILQRRPDGRNGWIYKLEDTRRVLYNLPDVLQARTVLVVEGEKPADAINEETKKIGQYGAGGYVATTAPHGAGKFRAEYAEIIKGKTVCVLPDNDEQGAAGANATLRVLADCGIEARRVELPNLPHKGDAADYLTNGGTIVKLFALCDVAPIWTPELEAPDTANTRAPRFPRIGLAEVFARPRLEYLIQDILLERGTGVISADYGAYKSFLALSMGLCVATGMDWHGRKTKRGNVVYVIAEGAYTTADRAKAFLIRHQIEAPENFHIIEMPVQIGDATQCSALIEELAEIKPAFVIFDTLAKCNVGRDENSAETMSLFTHGMERIAREFGAFVLTIHHNNKSGTARGSNSLPANLDASITLKRSPNRIVTVECDRVKGADFESFSLVGRIVELPEQDEYGRAVTSLVFDSTDTPAAEVPRADKTRDAVYNVLLEAQRPLKSGEWQRDCLDKLAVRGSSFDNYRRALIDSGAVEKSGALYLPKNPKNPKMGKMDGLTIPIFPNNPLGLGKVGKTGESDGEPYQAENDDRAVFGDEEETT